MPPLRGALRDKLIAEAENLAKDNKYSPFGAGSRQAAQAHINKKKKPSGGVPLSIDGKSAPEHFSLPELQEIANNPKLAADILEGHTGIAPDPEHVQSFIDRINENQKFKEYSQQASATPLESFDRAKESLDNNDVKPMVDFFINNPELASFGGGDGEPNDTFLKAAQRLKESGYGDEIKRAGRGVARPSSRDAAGFRRGPNAANVPNVPNPEDIDAIKRKAHQYTIPNENNGYRTTLENLGKNPEEIADSKDRQENDRLLGARNQRLSQKKSASPEDILARVRESARLEKLAAAAEQSADRIAPLSAMHDQAKKLLQGNINPKQDPLEEAAKKAREAGGMNIEGASKKYIDKAMGGPDRFIAKHANRYKDVIGAFREEAKQSLIDDVPLINRQFASKGAFYSAARQAAIQKDVADKEKMVAREAARLMAHGQDEAMKNYHQDRKHTLDAGEIAGKMRGASQDAALRASEALRVNALSAKDVAHKDASALATMGRAEQQQAQNAINVRMDEYNKQQERPWVELERKSAIAAGHPLQPVQYSPDTLNPAPPNAYGMGAGLLAQAAGMPKPYRKGGSVRAKYADGGAIARSAAELKQMAQHTNEPNEREQEMLSEGKNIRNNHIDPMGRYMFTLGSHMLANNRKDPLAMYGEGSLKGMEAHDLANSHNLTAQNKYVNLLNKINESRNTQQKYFSEYHINKMKHEESVRQHHANLGETKRAHDLMYSQTQGSGTQSAGIPSTNPYMPSFASKEAEKAHYKRDSKLIEQFDEDVKNTDTLKKSTKKMINLFNKGIGDTGPVAGRTPEILLNKIYEPETIANRRLFEKEFTKNVLDLMNKAKGPQTDTDREYMARTTVSLKDDPLTIKRYLADVEKVIKRDDEATHYIESAMERGVPIREAQKQWRKYADENPLFGEGPEQQKVPGGKSEDGGSVKMVDPEGNEWDIPKEKVQDAIKDGARIL